MWLVCFSIPYHLLGLTFAPEGPSGHGKSLLARRCEHHSVSFHVIVLNTGAVGSLLDVPTHTVNMTTLRSTRDIWRSYSMSPYEVCIQYDISLHTEDI